MSEQQNQNEAACGEPALTAELGADRDMIEERHIHEALAMLRVCHEKAAKPYLDRLAAIHSTRPPSPTKVTREQAEAMGFKVTNA